MRQERTKDLPQVPTRLLITCILIIAAFFISVICAAVSVGL
jgi:hypothetical protein